MNYVMLNGYVQTKSEYLRNSDGVTEYRFFISTYSKTVGKACAIPIKALGNMADKLYSELKDQYYVEILGEIVRVWDNKGKKALMYIVAGDVQYTPPKSKTTFYVSSSEFLELFSPKNILERAKKPMTPEEEQEKINKLSELNDDEE